MTKPNEFGKLTAPREGGRLERSVKGGAACKATRKRERSDLPLDSYETEDGWIQPSLGWVRFLETPMGSDYRKHLKR